MGDHDGLESVITIGWNTQISSSNVLRSTKNSFLRYANTICFA